jgi:membrane associated rhomboid family serine protease
VPLIAAYLLVMASALAAARLLRPAVDDDDPPAHRPRATLVAMVIVGLPTAVQLSVAPQLLHALRRDWTEIGNGEVWRLLTSLVVQDGGLAGASFNLATLLMVGSAAEAVWGPGRWAVLALGAGIGAELWGGVVQPVGGGCSVAVFGLAASLAVVVLLRGRGLPRLLGAVCLLTCGALLVAGDIHGGAAAIGAALAAGLAGRGRAVSRY